ncbi:antibiotic biosynthesis monooxygenase [Opitutaceae bacterium TAV5]|nr:antibiotic biosynthesis monooxygenase [Opitutaceae bacterium TAV5]
MIKTIVTLFAASSFCAAGGLAASGTVELFVRLQLKPGHKETFLSVMAENVRQSRLEPGNISFTAFEDRAQPDTLYLYERWKSQAALDAHMQTPHLKAVQAAASTSVSEAENLPIRDLHPVPPAEVLPVADPGPTSNVGVIFKLKPGARDAFLATWSNIPEIRQRPGCLLFSLHEVPGDPDTLVLFERWTTKAAHDAHLAQPDSQALGGILEPLLARPLMEGRVLLRDVVP